MKQYKGSHEDFDYFVVPTVPTSKQQRDTMSTISALSEIGIPASKIRLVFNMVENDDEPERVFSGLFEYHKAKKNFTLRTNAVIHANDIYAKIKSADQTITGILNDPTDFKAQLLEATTSEEKLRLAQLLAIKRLASGVTEELDAVFKTLLK